MPEQLQTESAKNPRAIFVWVLSAVIFFIIGVVVMPLFLRSSDCGNEGAARGGMLTIAAAQTDYYNNSSPRTYSTTLANLGNGNGAGGIGFIDPALSSGVKLGYTFVMVPGEPRADGTIWTWSAACWPLGYRSTGIRSFYIDQHAVIRVSDNGGHPGTPDMPPIDEH